MLDKEHVSINEEFLMTQLLAQKIQKGDFTPDVIFAICPGGAMIAEWLSRRFLGDRDAPVPVQVLYMKREVDGNGFVTMTVDTDRVAFPQSLPDGAKVLIVNDISRSGLTLKTACEVLKDKLSGKDIRHAGLICNTQASAEPNYYVAKTTKAIQFDWKSY